MSQNQFETLFRQLQQEVQSHQTQLQSLTSELTSTRQELTTTRQDPFSARQDVSSTRQELLNLQLRPRSFLPDPPRFSGKPFHLRTWLPSIKAKLRSDQLSGADAFDYVWDRLEQPQQASVLHLRYAAERNQSWNPHSIFQFFQRLCHNPREAQEAMQRFTGISQRTDESLVAYLARFERLMYEANAADWPAPTRVATLHRGLSPTLRQPLELSCDSLFSLTYDEYVELVQLSERRARRPNQSTRKPASSTTPAPSAPDHTR